MQEPNIFTIFTERLNRLGIPYAVTGSVASIIYGEPRLTHDVDIVLFLPADKIDAFIKIFPLEEFYVPPHEVLMNEIKRETRGNCNIIHQKTGFKADIYFVGQDSFQQWAIENANEIRLSKESVIRIAPPEYVIVKKLEFFKEGHAQKHISDIKAIIENSKDQINFDLLDSFIAEHGLENEWQKVD